MRNFRQNRGVFSLFMLIGLAVIVAAIMLLWNYLIPSIIGWTTINYWQALGLFVLTRLLFGGFHGHGFMRPPGKPEHLHHLWGKVKNMSPEERHAYDEHLSAIMIQNDVLDGAKLEGRMEGMEKGIEKGRMDIARNLKSMGLDIAAIQKATGLLPEEIQKL